MDIRYNIPASLYTAPGGETWARVLVAVAVAVALWVAI